MKIALDKVMFILRIIVCLSFIGLVAMYFFTNIEIRKETIVIILIITIISFLPYILKKIK